MTSAEAIRLALHEYPSYTWVLWTTRQPRPDTWILADGGWDEPTALALVTPSCVMVYDYASSSAEV